MNDLAVKVHLDSNGEDLAIEHIQDVEPLLEQNKLARTMEQNCDWGREIAEIPDVISVRWLDEEHAKGNTDLRMFTKEWSAVVRKKLYDPEWAYLRTDKPGLITGWMGFGS